MSKHPSPRLDQLRAMREAQFASMTVRQKGQEKPAAAPAEKPGAAPPSAKPGKPAAAKKMKAGKAVAKTKARKAKGKKAQR